METENDGLSYPIQKEMAQYEAGKEGKSFAKKERDLRLFRPRPYADGKKATNHLFVVSYPFNKFDWFKDWSLSHYYLRLPIHRVEMDVPGSKFPDRKMVLCEEQVNVYAKTLDQSEPFPGTPKCPLCHRSGLAWNRYRQAKKALGLGGTVDKDRFKAVIQQHPEVNAVRDEARLYQTRDVFLIAVLDYDKLTGLVDLEEGEEDISLQAWLAPVKIRDGLYGAQKAGCKFWDYAGGNFRQINVTRDNSKGARYCQYSVGYEFAPTQLDADVLAYLQNADVRPLDPSNFIECWDQEEKIVFTGADLYKAETPQLSQKDSEVFAESVANPPPPSPALRRAAVATATHNDQAPPVAAMTQAAPQPAPNAGPRRVRIFNNKPNA